MKANPLTVCCVLLCILLRVPANATYRGGFFDISHKPTVHFDKKSLTWTLRNQVLERVVHFDMKAGGLSTLSVKNLRTGRSLGIVSGAEGRFTFAGLLKEPPVLLSDWRYTTNPPTGGWAQLSFDDDTWTKGSLRLTHTRRRVPDRFATPPLYSRCVLPSGLIQPKHNYALILDHALMGSAEIYADGKLLRAVRQEERAEELSLQLDLPPATRIIAVKITGHLLNGIALAEEGTAPADVDLNSDWKYSVQSVNAGEDNSLILTIGLTGTGRYEGFVLDVAYQIFAGDEPFCAKWFRFVSHRSGRFLLESVCYDGWTALSPMPSELEAVNAAQSDTQAHNVLMLTVNGPQSRIETDATGKQLLLVLRPYNEVHTASALEMPHSVLAWTQGTRQTGAFLVQLFQGQYVAHGSPDTVPVAYRTVGYGPNISAALCQDIVPIVARLGAKAFVLDDGWQKNSRQGDLAEADARYGDWMVNDAPDHFPKGLLPVAEAVRGAGMRFGLGFDATRVSGNASGFLQHPEWLHNAGVSPYPGMPIRLPHMCFASPWGLQFTQNVRQICRQYGVNYVRMTGILFEDSCLSPAHDHPVLHALPGQLESWLNLCGVLRELDPTCVMEADGRALEADGRIWMITLPSADATNSNVRSGLQPSFTTSQFTPCHAEEKDVSAAQARVMLEFEFVYAAAGSGSNLVFGGDVKKMTGEETTLVRKWVEWHEANRPWLAFTQPFANSPDEANTSAALSTRDVIGTLHLRNPIAGRYGYVYLFNGSDKDVQTTCSFTPEDYFVRLRPENLHIVRVKDGTNVPFTVRKGAIVLDKITFAPQDWELYELRER